MCFVTILTNSKSSATKNVNANKVGEDAKQARQLNFYYSTKIELLKTKNAVVNMPTITQTHITNKSKNKTQKRRT